MAEERETEAERGGEDREKQSKSRDIETEMGNGDLGRTVRQLLRKMGLQGQKW